MPKYVIHIEKNNARKQWDSYADAYPDRVEELRNFLIENPNDRLKAAGKLKKLQGRYKGILQYDLTDGDRCWYRVDSDELAVYIEYIGPHPG